MHENHETQITCKLAQAIPAPAQNIYTGDVEEVRQPPPHVWQVAGYNTCAALSRCHAVTLSRARNISHLIFAFHPEISCSHSDCSGYFCPGWFMKWRTHHFHFSREQSLWLHSRHVPVMLHAGTGASNQETRLSTGDQTSQGHARAILLPWVAVAVTMLQEILTLTRVPTCQLSAVGLHNGKQLYGLFCCDHVGQSPV